MRLGILVRQRVYREASTPCGLAVGVGFRKACTARDLAALVRSALSRVLEAHPGLAHGSATLVTIAEKDRPVLHEVAGTLGLPVMILPKDALACDDHRVTVASALAKACLGIPSVAEAAALAAAGPGSRLLVTRVSGPDATCAIAVSASGHPA